MEAVKIKQATKAGFAIWRVGGGGRSIIPGFQNEKRQSSREWRDMPNTNGRQSRRFQIGGR